jgi:hypothetical protein
LFDATGEFLAPAADWAPWRDAIARNLADLERISACADGATACRVHSAASAICSTARQR